MSGRKLSIAIACGGTGGHTFPGIATGRLLRERGHDVSLWLAGRAVEDKVVAEWQGKVFVTGARRLRPTLRGGVGIFGCFRRCLVEIDAQQTDVLLAMGSYASFAPFLAALYRRIPRVLHEGNAVPGKAVSKLCRLATSTAISFEESASYLPQRERLVRTGLPVRLELRDAKPMTGFRSGQGFTVLVTGGSQGARAINAVAARALANFHEGGADLRVIHQSGEADREAVEKIYARSGVDSQVFGFLDMGPALAVADLVIARAGAATCAELALCGKPALLVPLPTAVRDHQTANAEAMRRWGAADICRQGDFTVEWLGSYLDGIARDRARRQVMSAAALRLAAPQAAAELAELVVSAAG